uniref:Integrase catalytic domain-containing protein n=2 Tax=Caenorhabditis japonica TaxID=281687 RepID=A0A8R1I7X8_CAEJA
MCESHGITHKTTATYCPRSNGAAERFADILKRGIAKIKGSASINQRVLNNFLISYRNTPHAALNGATPAECHFSRKMLAERAFENTEWTHYQNEMKWAYDKRNGARANTFKVGQKVYARVQHVNKWSWGYGKVPTAHHSATAACRTVLAKGGDKNGGRREHFDELVFELFAICAENSQSLTLRHSLVSQSLRRSQHNRRAPFRYDPCSELQSHSEDRAPKRGSAPYADRAAAHSRGLHIASNCRLAPSQGRTKGNFVKGGRGRPKRGVQPAYIALLQQSYTNCTTTITPFHKKIKIPITIGVRQGDPISPNLFSACLESVFNKMTWQHLRGDDTGICGKVGLRMNTNKTKVMRNQFARQSPVNVTHNNATTCIEKVNEYVYLGRLLNQNHELEPEFHRRRRASWAALKNIKSTTDALSCPRIRAQLFDSIVLPVRDPLLVIKKKKLGWAGHIMGKNDGRWTRLGQEWYPIGEKRPVGKQRMRWSDSLKKEISLFDGEDLKTHWSTIAKDGMAWNAVIRDNIT